MRTSLIFRLEISGAWYHDITYEILKMIAAKVMVGPLSSYIDALASLDRPCINKRIHLGSVDRLHTDLYTFVILVLIVVECTHFLCGQVLQKHACQPIALYAAHGRWIALLFDAVACKSMEVSRLTLWQPPAQQRNEHLK